jgi:hypothetical protein
VRAYITATAADMTSTIEVIFYNPGNVVVAWDKVVLKRKDTTVGELSGCSTTG